ncbi:PH domain-containing protein, partial [Listeria innocua]|nr:PH domain-containing protein [Listeria innocua]
MFDKLMGKAAIVTESSYGIERFLEDDEKI